MVSVGALFAGYGGIELALASVLDTEPAWFAEFDKAPSRILAHHWPDVPNFGDVTQVDWATVEPVDIIAGGSPCQDLSHAGKRAGMKAGTRSGLWASMCDAIDIIRPKLVVWENVRGALSAEADSAVEPCPLCVGDRPGPTLRALGRVLGDLAELGYDARWYGLRAADVGAAHGRFRVFLFATPADCDLAGLQERRDARGVRPAQAGAPAAVDGDRRELPADDLTLLPTPLASDAGPRGGTTGYGLRDWSRSMPSPMFRTPTAQLAVNGGSQHPDKRKGGGHGPTLADEVEHLLPTPGVAGGGKKVPEDAHWSGNAAYKPDGTKVQVHLDYIAENRLLPTPTSSDSKASGAHGYGGNEFCTLTDATVRQAQDWREYEAAIRRQERAFGRPAPLPTEPGAKGQPRLSPRFVEWLMGLPDGWVTDVPGISRNDQLKALGNGVVPQQCAAALRAFIHDAREAA